MKTFIAEPFAQKVGVTTNYEGFIRHELEYSLALHDKELVDEDNVPVTEKDIIHCQGMAGYWKYHDGVKFLIYIKNPKDTSCIFHESLHTAHQIMEHCGQPVEMSSTELQAYLMEFIAKNVIELVKGK